MSSMGQVGAWSSDLAPGGKMGGRIVLAMAVVCFSAPGAAHAQTLQPPLAVDDVALRNEGVASVVINVLSNDSGSSLSVYDYTQPQFGTVSRSGTSLRYTAGPSANRLALRDAFTYTAVTPAGLADSAVVYVDLANLPPVAVADAVTIPRNRPFTFDPRQNDSDPGGDPLSITGVTQPQVGAATFTATSVTYTPPFNHTGQATFNYTISDGEGGVASAPIVVTISTANQPPVALGGYFGAVAWDQTITIDVRLFDSDPDGDPITVISAGPPSPAVGSAGVAYQGAGVVYTAPPAPYYGQVSFPYTISDGFGGTATAIISLMVESGA